MILESYGYSGAFKKVKESSFRKDLARHYEGLGIERAINPGDVANHLSAVLQRFSRPLELQFAPATGGKHGAIDT
jgi:hypothetical protein|eukprot:COSAG01_NODE_333_length_18717_cov_40.372072_11_plen_75_part_00